MRLLKLFARSVLAITLAGIAAKANAQSIDELYQAAKKEGALSLNGGGPAGLYEPWAQEFERRFPGIKVKLTADFSNILASIIDREIAEKKLSVDLTIFRQAMTLQDVADRLIADLVPQIGPPPHNPVTGLAARVPRAATPLPRPRAP